MRPPFELPTDQDHNAPPVNPLPPAVVVLALAIFGIELVFTAAGSGILGGPAGTGWRLAAIERFGFYQPMFDWMIQNGTIRWDFMARFVTYPFIHGTFTHALFVLVFLLALGKLVGEVLSNSSVLGALVYGLVWDTRVVLFGGFPGAYGMVGAYTFILWAGLAGRATGLQAFALIAFLLGIQLVFGLLFGGGMSWVAEISGFAAGFGLAFLVSPGGWTAIVAKLRRR
jgi:membrane associated rhomboid family serine protease